PGRLRRLVRRAFRAGPQLGSVPVQDRDQFVVLDVAEALADVGFAQESEVRQQLTEAHVGRQGPHFGQHGQRLALHVAHGSRSPILGSPANALGSLPITSTRISVPGASLAMRVARVTALYSTSTPSVPSCT